MTSLQTSLQCTTGLKKPSSSPNWKTCIKVYILLPRSELQEKWYFLFLFVMASLFWGVVISEVSFLITNKWVDCNSDTDFRGPPISMGVSPLFHIFFLSNTFYMKVMENSQLQLAKVGKLTAKSGHFSSLRRPMKATHNPSCKESWNPEVFRLLENTAILTTSILLMHQATSTQPEPDKVNPHISHTKVTLPPSRS